MTLGRLPVHFAPAEAAETLQGVELGEGELFDALAQALGLPDYFGRNWDALEECLRDLEVAITLLVPNAATRWKQAPEEMRTLVDVWLAASAARGGTLQLVFIW